MLYSPVILAAASLVYDDSIDTWIIKVDANDAVVSVRATDSVGQNQQQIIEYLIKENRVRDRHA